MDIQGIPGTIHKKREALEKRGSRGLHGKNVLKLEGADPTSSICFVEECLCDATTAIRTESITCFLV